MILRLVAGQKHSYVALSKWQRSRGRTLIVAERIVAVQLGRVVVLRVVVVQRLAALHQTVLLVGGERLEFFGEKQRFARLTVTWRDV